MENNVNNQFNNDIAPLPARPQFLSVLCILTWICCGLMIFKPISTLVFQPSAEQQEQRLEKMRELSPEAADKMQAVMTSQTSSERIMSALLNIIAIALSAYGAVMMWQLKKTGFYLYIAGELLPYLGFAFGGAQAMSALNAMGGGIGTAMVGIGVALMVILDLVFIIMYGVNLKYMKK